MNTYTPPMPYVTWDYNKEDHIFDAESRVRTMVDAYLEAAVWAEKPDEEDWDGANWSQSALDLAHFDCCAFLRLAKGNIKGWDMSQLGHDFWLTRNGHGVSFVDRDFSGGFERKELYDLAKVFKEEYVYLGDDGKLYLG